MLAQNSTQSDTLSRGRVVPREETIGKKAEERQIKVYSKEPLMKAHFDSYSRDLRQRFRRMLGLYDTDEWKVNLRVMLYGNADEVHSGGDIGLKGEFNEANQFNLKLKVMVHDRFEEENYRRAFIRMLLVEQMLGGFLDNPEAFSDTNFTPPDWLVHGFDYNMRHQELGRPSSFYSGYLKSGQLMPVSDIIKPQQAQGLTPTSLTLFRASASVLIGALCGQKGGGESMLGMLGDFALDPNAKSDVLIRKHFPSFRETGQGLDKWWALQLATMAQQQSFEYYSAAETERNLTQALAIVFPGKPKDGPSASAKKVGSQKAGRQLLNRLKESGKGGKAQISEPGEFRGSIADYRAFVGRPGWENMLRHRQASVAILKIKAFPLYHQVFDRYIALIPKMVNRKFEGVDKELRELIEMRRQMTETLSQTREYLNHYEAARTPGMSGAFDSYLEFKNKPGINQVTEMKPSRSI